MNTKEMINQSLQKGWHFFDPDTMAFWGSEVKDSPNRYFLFITAEDNFDRTKKLYSVRWFNSNTGEVEALSFQQFETYDAANALRHDITNKIALIACERHIERLERTRVSSEGVFAVKFTDGTHAQIDCLEHFVIAM